MVPDPDPPTDPTPCFSDLQDEKNLFFFIFFSYDLSDSTLSSPLKNLILCKKFCVKFYFSSIISVR
jgi:hypothetical protein